jgi:hypothetical protein
VIGRSRPLLPTASLCIGLFAFAFVAAPYSCAWGLTAYFCCGVAVVVTLLAMPFALNRAQPLWWRAAVALGIGLLGSGIWLACLIAANFQIICRLF